MKLLFILALLLAWPTYGLSLLAWITLWVISNKNQSENGQPNKMPASRPVMYQSKQVPSWAGDRQKNETFVLGIQNRAMNYGVPQVFLQATLMRKEIFASLIGHAAELESQGRSFVDQQVSVSKKLVDMWKSEGTAYAAEVNDGRYLESDGKSGPPSWANDEQMQRDFATGVQILSGPDGLSPEALNAMFSLEQPLEKAIAIAGAVERQGGAFKDQQFAVKNFKVRWWSELSPSLRETFSEGFRH